VRSRGQRQFFAALRNEKKKQTTATARATADPFGDDDKKGKDNGNK
jgi:hypothetical protein